MNLTENWNETKTALVDGLEGNKKVVMDQSIHESMRFLKFENSTTLQMI